MESPIVISVSLNRVWLNLSGDHFFTTESNEPRWLKNSHSETHCLKCSTI